MKKIIKRTGNSLAVVFNKEEQTVYNIKEGALFDIEICEIKQKKTVRDDKDKDN